MLQPAWVESSAGMLCSWGDQAQLYGVLWRGNLGDAQEDVYIVKRHAHVVSLRLTEGSLQGCRVTAGSMWTW